jgi:hypothetical protein
MALRDDTISRLIMQGVFGTPPTSRMASENKATRQRKPSLASRLKAARKAGAEAGAILPNGTVTLNFGEAARTDATTTNPWDAAVADLEAARATKQ